MELKPRIDGKQELILENRDEIDLARFALHGRANRLHFRPKLRNAMFHTAAIMAGVLRARNSQNEDLYPDKLTLAPEETKRTIDAMNWVANDNTAPGDFAADVSAALQSLEQHSEEAHSA